MELSGWGRYPVLDCQVARLRRSDELGDLLARNRTLIARGNGRSYGDAALNPGLTLSMLAMDRLQAFDPDTGLLTCQAGVRLSDILATFVPRGWFPAVVPGTELVTVGGMIAADVHGKNHHCDGSFGAHVEALTLATADGEIRECSRTEHADLFRATLGGMGLTGVILSARFRLKPIETAFVLEETLAARDLDETMALFEASRDWPYSVAWIDCLARGAKLGRSLLTRGAFMDRNALPSRLADDPLRRPRAGTLRVPVDAPAALLNRTSIGVFNVLYYRRGRARVGARPLHFDLGDKGRKKQKI
jgi:FAD/FMN-containing dehydrogenase